MLIQRDQVIAGLPAVDARSLMRELEPCAQTADRIAELAGVADGQALVDALLADGLIEVGPPGMSTWHCPEEEADWRSRSYWTTSVAGTALAKARIGRPMPRANAERLLDRVGAINEDPNGLFWIEWVEIFGSFTNPDRDQVGDVDVRILATGRYSSREQTARENALADGSGRSFGTMVDYLGYAQNELRRTLKNRSSLVDLQLDIGESSPLPDGATVRRVYEREAPGNSAVADGDPTPGDVPPPEEWSDAQWVKLRRAATGTDPSDN